MDMSDAAASIVTASIAAVLPLAAVAIGWVFRGRKMDRRAIIKADLDMLREIPVEMTEVRALVEAHIVKDLRDLYTEAPSAARQERYTSVQRTVAVLVLIFVIYTILSSPQASGEVVSNGWDQIQHGASSAILPAPLILLVLFACALLGALLFTLGPFDVSRRHRRRQR